MPKILFTDITLRQLQPPKTGQVDYWDKALPGFGVRVSQGGAKSFVLVHGRHRHRTTLGRVGVVSLREARDAARRILAENTLGKHRHPRITFENFSKEFFVECERRIRPRTIVEYRRIFNRYFLPTLRFEVMEDITRQSIQKIIDRMADTPAMQNGAFAFIRLYMRAGLRRGYLSASPCAGMRLPARLVSRDRVLTDEELRTIWQAAGEAGAFGRIVRLLILTGQRRGEIAGLTKDYVDRRSRTITLPRSLSKNGREHTFPFGDLADEIFESIPEHARSYLLSDPRYDTRFDGWSKSKRELDRACGIAPWTLHDLRRTFATNLAGLGVAPHVIERLLNHVSGTISGIAAVYNRHSYLEEMRRVIALWEAKLKSLTDARQLAA